MEEVSDIRAVFVVLCFVVFFDVVDDVFSDHILGVGIAERVIDHYSRFFEFLEVI